MKKHRLWLFFALLPLAVASALAVRTFAQAPTEAALRPPKGAKVAIIIFEDLQCPDCARANPLVEEAAKTYKIPLVRYDFPLPQHDWAMQAAIFARYFDTKKLGDEYRDAVFQHQREITKDSLRQFTENFAKEHKTSLPFAVDPTGKFDAAIKKDQDLGKRVGLTHTPTIYVVSNKRTGTPFVEVVDRSQLYQLIDAMKAQAE